MSFAILAAIDAVTLLAFHLAHPFKHDRWLETVAFGVIGVFFLALLGVGYYGAPSLVHPLLALVIALALPLTTFVHYLRLRHLHSLTRAVLNPHFRPSALGSLRAHLESARGPRVRAQRARRAAFMLADAELYEEAESLIEDLPAPRLYASQRVLVANDLAFYRIRLGKLEAARAALATVTTPATRWPFLAQKDALLTALEGDFDGALAIAGKIDERRLAKPQRAGLALARAHAHAGKGDVEKANEALRALSALDPNWIRIATQPNGPASSLAVALAAESSPYR